MSNLPSLPPALPHKIDKFFHHLAPLRTLGGRLVLQWKCQVDLRCNLALYQQNDPSFAVKSEQNDEEAIAAYWIDVALKDLSPVPVWQPAKRQELALRHLAVYLESSCYWAAKAVYQNHQDRTWEEYFAIAQFILYNGNNNYLLATLKQWLQKYNPARASLTTYIEDVLANTIRDELQVGKFSDWRLLCHNITSRKKLKEALQRLGYGEDQISKILFAWKYFKIVYLNNKVENPDRRRGQKWSNPDPADFREAAQLYNAEKLFPAAPSDVLASNKTITGNELEEWMKTCINALRSYSPVILEVPLETEKKSQDGDEFKTTENSSEPNYPSIWQEDESGKQQEAIAQDAVFRTEIENIQIRVEQAIQKRKLKDYHKKIPYLYYGIGLSQSQIGEIVSLNQSRITCHLSDYYEKPLLEASIVSLSCEEQKADVWDWFFKDYGASTNLMKNIVSKAKKKISNEYKEVIKLHFEDNFTSEQVAAILGISESEAYLKIGIAKSSLETEVFKEINFKLVETWLKCLYKEPLDSVLNQAINNFESELKVIIEYRYYLRRTEAYIAQQLNIDKNIVEDKIYLAKIQLQNVLVKWIGENLEIALAQDAQLSRIERMVEEWLENLYTRSGRMA